MSMFDKLGSKKRPIVLGTYEKMELERILERAEFDYAYADAEDKGAIRSAAREEILKRWPQLYDHCHIRVHFNEDDARREEADRWWEARRREARQKAQQIEAPEFFRGSV